MTGGLRERRCLWTFLDARRLFRMAQSSIKWATRRWLEKLRLNGSRELNGASLFCARVRSGAHLVRWNLEDYWFVPSYISRNARRKPLGKPKTWLMLLTFVWFSPVAGSLMASILQEHCRVQCSVRLSESYHMEGIRRGYCLRAASRAGKSLIHRAVRYNTLLALATKRKQKKLLNSLLKTKNKSRIRCLDAFHWQAALSQSPSSDA